MPPKPFRQPPSFPKLAVAKPPPTPTKTSTVDSRSFSDVIKGRNTAKGNSVVTGQVADVEKKGSVIVSLQMPKPVNVWTKNNEKQTPIAPIPQVQNASAAQKAPIPQVQNASAAQKAPNPQIQNASAAQKAPIPQIQNASAQITQKTPNQHVQSSKAQYAQNTPAQYGQNSPRRHAPQGYHKNEDHKSNSARLFNTRFQGHPQRNQAPEQPVSVGFIASENDFPAIGEASAAVPAVPAAPVLQPPPQICENKVPEVPTCNVFPLLRKLWTKPAALPMIVAKYLTFPMMNHHFHNGYIKNLCNPSAQYGKVCQFLYAPGQTMVDLNVTWYIINNDNNEWTCVKNPFTEYAASRTPERFKIIATVRYGKISRRNLILLQSRNFTPWMPPTSLSRTSLYLPGSNLGCYCTLESISELAFLISGLGGEQPQIDAVIPKQIYFRHSVVTITLNLRSRSTSRARQALELPQVNENENNEGMGGNGNDEAQKNEDEKQKNNE